MARKDKCLSVSSDFVLYMTAVAFLSAGLVVLQHFCMNHGDGDFITGTCHLETHMGSFVAGFLTLFTIAMASLIASTIEAYRSMKLSSGITEGVYIAMGSSSPFISPYQLRALRTPWAPAMLLIILCTMAPQWIQFSVNFGIKTATVYVQNPSTVDVFNAYSHYNATVILPPSDLSSAVGVLAKMRIYGSTSIVTSTVTDGGAAVTTSVVRDGYLRPVITVHSDASNAFARVETVATITSTCTYDTFVGPLFMVVPQTSANVNATLTLPALNLGAAAVYDILYKNPTNNSLLFQSSLSLPMCQFGKCSSLDPGTQVSVRAATCMSTVAVQDQDIIYTVSTDSVTLRKMVSNVTTVNVIDLASLIVAFADSVEAAPEGVDSPAYADGVLTMYSSFPPGSLNQSEANVLHTKLCASASLALKSLWTSNINNGSALVIEDDGLQGTAFETYTAVPLFNTQQLTYISTTNVIIIAGVLTGAACVVGLVGILFAVTSRINVKPVTDSALLYNADAALIATKQDLQKGLSNDPDAQMAHEFSPDTVLHCREFVSEHPASADATKNDILCRVNISYSNTGTIPNKCDEYC